MHATQGLQPPPFTGANSVLWNERPLYEFSANDLLARQARQESNARSYPRCIPLALKRAKGIYVEDVEGRLFIDCLAGAGTLALGHNHPVVIEAIRRVLDDELPLHTLDLTTPVKDRFVQDLFGVLPAGFAAKAKIQFCGPTGADAVEAALKLARTATGRRNVLAFQGAYHGMTQGALAVMGSHGPKRALDGLFTGAQFLPFPYDYRCPFGVGGEKGVEIGLNYISNLLNDPESGVLPPAAVIVEPVQGEGGVIPASAAWLRPLGADARGGRAADPRRGAERLRPHRRDVRLRARRHRARHPGAVKGDRRQPAAVADRLSRGIGHLAAGRARGHVPRQPDGDGRRLGDAALHAIRGTARARCGHGRAPHRTIARAATTLAADRRRAWPRSDAGRGTRCPDGPSDRLGHPPGHPELASRVQRECLKRGLILELGGRLGAVARFLPPLVITPDQIDQVAAIFAAAFEAAV